MWQKSAGVYKTEEEITARGVCIVCISLCGPACLSLDLCSLSVCVLGAGDRLAAVSLSVHLVRPEAHL